MRRRPSTRVAVFLAIVVASLAVAAGYAGWAASRTDSPSARAGARSASAAIANLPAGPRLVFQNYSRDDNIGKVALLPRGTAVARTLTELVCERVYFAAGRGICLRSDASVMGQEYRVTFFGPGFGGGTPNEFSLPGIPSRTRISSDGRHGAVTAFVFGHSYKDAVFSTQTLIVDMATGSILGDLEKFTLLRAGKPMRSPDFNYWGVTFARDSDRFYATLRTRAKTYLVEGDVRARQARILHEGVECPSLSPDNKRIAFKKMTATGGTWRLHVLDLATMIETPLAETRSVDDQVEWLDDGRIVYGVEEGIWAVPADGTGTPRQLLPQALSPAVVRA